MKQSKEVKATGPFYITSHSQGRGIVHFIIYPAFPEYGEGWAESRFKHEGGGPNVFVSMGTARVLGEFLNSVYPPEMVEAWEARIKAILDEESKDTLMAECHKCGIVTSIHKDWVYCPTCGGKFDKEIERRYEVPRR